MNCLQQMSHKIQQICITGERATHKFYDQILADLSAKSTDEISLLFGDCTGVDTDAKKICEILGLKYTVFPADWAKHGLTAGPIRNKQMIDLLNPACDEVWAYHTDISKSKGTKNTISLAKKKQIRVIVKIGI